MEDSSDFMKKIEDIRLAEKEAENISKSTNQKVEKILQDAKNDLNSLRAKNNEEIVALKNNAINESKFQIEKEVNDLIQKAKDKSSKSSELCISRKEAEALLRFFYGLV